MIKTLPLNQRCCVIAALSMTCCSPASADFIADSKASFETRNFYINRDFRQENAPQAKAEEWVQSFIGRFESGYTVGTFGFGLEALALEGVKLDSSRYRSGTALLPVGSSSQQPVDEFGSLGLTAKVRVSKTVFRVGSLQPSLPVVLYSDVRAIPSTFTGGMTTSEDIKNLTLNFGRITQDKPRDSSGMDKLQYGGHTSDYFDFAGGTHKLMPGLDVTAYTSELQDIYRQQYVGIVHTLPLGEGLSLRTDLRYFDSDDSGAAKAGRIDSRNFNGMLGLSVDAHRISAGWQRLSGPSAMPYLAGATPFIVNNVTYNLFIKPEEKSWQIRYDYDFAALGLPGLTFMSRYIKGSGAKQGRVTDGHEWERDTDVSYAFQDGKLRGLSLKWRNATFRSSNGLTTDIDENRLVIAYSMPIW